MFRARKASSKKPAAATSKTRQATDDGDAARDDVNHAIPSIPSASPSGGEDDNGDVDAVDAIRARLQQKQRKPPDFTSKKANKRPSVVASFDDDDDDGPSFRLKKGKIARVPVASATSAADQSPSDSASHSLYSTENLNALKAAQKHFVKAVDDDTLVPSPSPSPVSTKVNNHHLDVPIEEEETFIPLNPSSLPPDHSDTFHGSDRRHLEEASLDTDDLPHEGEDADDDPGDMQWEADQLRRAGLVPPSRPAPLYSKTSSSHLSFHSLGHVITKLQSTHATMVDQMDARARDVHRVDVELTQLASSIAALDDELAACGTTFDAMQTLWAYLTTLCHCLRAKGRALDRMSDSTRSESDSTRSESTHIQVWADVDDEFASLVAVLARFSQWRSDPTTAASYESTYAALALAQLIVPYVRADLLSFNPWRHRWEDLAWVAVVRAFDSQGHSQSHSQSHSLAPSLESVGVDLVVQKAMEMMQHFDWHCQIHVEHALYLLQSVGGGLQEMMADALAARALHTMRSGAVVAKNPVFQKHLRMLRLPQTNALVATLCQEEFHRVRDAALRRPDGDDNMRILPSDAVFLVDQVLGIVEDWPIYCHEARPVLMQYADLVNHHLPDVPAKQQLVNCIERKLKANSIRQE
ncbi:hypothetical protein DYB30_006157 [Aphanomyces astaci]|uniref:GCF C-terminal domain-containing protein n=1 Tax=Aphanomyces astaci TaxID=112090 RepID=A0A397EBQ5_APHAT|nr:hypothetical protein DYB30_006157 [Aphanomyces astaci]